MIVCGRAKLSKTFAAMKHYNVCEEIIFKKSFYLYFDFLLNDLQVQNAKASGIIDFVFKITANSF